jgi:hypothetical protein
VGDWPLPHVTKDKGEGAAGVITQIGHAYSISISKSGWVPHDPCSSHPCIVTTSKSQNLSILNCDFFSLRWFWFRWGCVRGGTCAASLLIESLMVESLRRRSRTGALRINVDASTNEKFPTSQKIKFPFTFETFGGFVVVASVPELTGVVGRSPRIRARKGQI